MLNYKQKTESENIMESSQLIKREEIGHLRYIYYKKKGKEIIDIKWVDIENGECWENTLERKKGTQTVVEIHTDTEKVNWA